MEKEYEYFGFWVEIKARHPTVSDPSDLWLADVHYRWGRPTGHRDDWIMLDRGKQAPTLDPETAIRNAATEVQRHLDPLIREIRAGKL